MKVKEKTSELFLLIIGIQVSLLVLLISERYLISIIEKKKNILYYQRFFDNINKSKIVLNVAFISIVIILINPLRLITIFNPYIFNVFGEQYPDIIRSL